MSKSRNVETSERDVTTVSRNVTAAPADDEEPLAQRPQKRLNDRNMIDETQQVNGVSRRAVLKAGVASVAALGLVGPVAATQHGVTSETEDAFGQGPGGGVVAPDGATIRRTKNGISMTVSMPTPESGEYEYPKSGVFSGPGHPETFSLWAFVFNDPDSEDWDGAFFVAGHVVGGSTLNLSGRVSTNTDPFAGEQLDNPEGAEVHLAVAPHGALDADLMPEQIKTPTGPGPDIWWLALFDPPG